MAKANLILFYGLGEEILTGEQIFYDLKKMDLEVFDDFGDSPEVDYDLDVLLYL